MSEETTSPALRSLLPKGWRSWVAWGLMLATVLVSPWFTALFFPPASTVVGVIVAVAALVAIRYRGSVHGTIDGKLSLREPLPWVLLYALYTLLTNLWSASMVNSIQVTLLEVSALLLFVVVYQSAGALWRAFVPAFLLIGIALFVFGMGAGVQWWSATDAVYDHNLLASVFEYHNTFGAFMLAVGLVAYFLGIDYKKWWINTLGAAAYIVAIDGIVGSYSRTMWVLMPIAILAALIVKSWLKKSYRPTVVGIVLSLISLLGAYFTLKALNNSASKDVIGVLATMVIGAVAVSFADRRTAELRISGKIFAITIGALIVIAGIFMTVFRHKLFYGSTGVATRISSITLHSVSLQERFYYYKNAVSMWANAPVFGGGGGTWTTKFQAFQTIPYWSTQSHSNVVDHLLNGGLLGFVLWGIVLVLIIVRVVRALRSDAATVEEKLARLGFAFAALFMFAHAVLDFDFAFGYIVLIFWSLAALASAPYQTDVSLSSVLHIRVASAWTYVTGVVMALLGLSLGLSQLVGQNATTGSAVGSFFAPYDANLQLNLAQQDLQSAVSSQNSSLGAQAWSHTQSAEAYGKWDPNVQSQTAVIAYQLGHMPRAVAWAERSYRDAPFNSAVIRNLLGIELWDSASQFKVNPAVAKAQLSGIIQKYNDFSAINQQINYKLFADAIPVKQDASMQVYIGTANYFLGHYRASLQAMNPFLTDNRDQAAINLYDIITVLDDVHLHQSTSTDLALMQQIKSNPSALSEYEYIVKQSS